MGVANFFFLKGNPVCSKTIELLPGGTTYIVKISDNEMGVSCLAKVELDEEGSYRILPLFEDVPRLFSPYRSAGKIHMIRLRVVMIVFEPSKNRGEVLLSGLEANKNRPPELIGRLG
jgi:hypothetical protein